MTRKRLTLLLTIAFVLAVAGSASAKGEPKNMQPFNRVVTGPAATRDTQSGVAELPIQGEPKNEPPFTRPVEGATIVVGSSAAFDWGDSAIGAAAGLGLALSLVGGVVLVRNSARRTPTPAR